MRILLIFILDVVSVLCSGWVLSVLWGWFVTPFGLGEISIPMAIGIACVSSMLNGGKNIEVDHKNNDELIDFFSKKVGRLVSVLSIGWIASFFV